MQKHILFILILIVSFIGNGQSGWTIGDVFDFDVGDEFHFERTNQPTNAQRIKILNKYWTNNSQTVNYVQENDNYYIVPDFSTSPSSSYYVFEYFIDTISYSNLGNPIESIFIPYDSTFHEYDTIIGNQSSLCNETFVENYVSTSIFEPDMYSLKYSIGLGKIDDYYYEGGTGTGTSYYQTSMFYYQKDSISCGTRDNTTMSINENVANYNFYPNPTTGQIYLKTDVSHEVSEIRISDQLGKIVYQSETLNQINIEPLPKGVYYIQLTDSHGLISQPERIIKY